MSFELGEPLPHSIIAEDLDTNRHASVSPRKIKDVLVATDAEPAILPVGESLIGVEPDRLHGETSHVHNLHQMVEVISPGFRPAKVLEHLWHAEEVEKTEERVILEKVVFMVGEEHDDSFRTIEMPPEQALRVLQTLKVREVTDPVRFLDRMAEAKTQDDEEQAGSSSTLSEDKEVTVEGSKKAA